MNPARWSWRVKFLAVVAIAEPLASTYYDPANRLPWLMAWFGVGITYAALAWRARAEPDSDWKFDMFIAAGFLVAPLLGLLLGWNASRSGGRWAAVAFGTELGTAWRARRAARPAAQA